MLYGYKEKVDNQIATIVSAADTVDEYDNWVGTVSKQMPHPNLSHMVLQVLWIILHEMNFMDISARY
jgi:hypothetical protein